MPDQVVWILSRQAALAIALGVIVWGFVDVHSAVSVLIGGSIGVIANLGYVLRAMRLTSGSDPVKLYRAQAAGEGFKFLLTLAGFALVFLGYREVAVLPLFLGYASTFVIYWLALLKQR
ncbi:MAG: ATP synthase subunit I [Azonexus sp.]|nr:ATP synthase subunit I [Betaproteobacteria bacterium]MBK8919799.1 ATP synthase subunit I [Betaproteobacteria bacterium]MBP6035658.1 ATP synthase subunit I [Azonexus sp.]MBP6906962.1 ATP synthase subunit I [Azonexus sp.]